MVVWVGEAEVGFDPGELDAGDLAAADGEDGPGEMVEGEGVLETEGVGGVEDGDGFGVSAFYFRLVFGKVGRLEV